MKEILHTLTIRNGSRIEDLVRSFDFVCLEGASYPSTEKFKELTKTTWRDEHGDDVYIPSSLMKESFDMVIPIGCYGERNGETAGEKRDKLVSFLSTDLSSDGLKIYSPLEQKGYSGCYLKECKDVEYQKRGDTEILLCTLVFNVFNPDTSYNGE